VKIGVIGAGRQDVARALDALPRRRLVGEETRR